MALLANTFIAGLLFGIGLALSEMTDPGRVTGFLDVAGRWDPTLLFVMGGALAVTLPAFQFVLRRSGPLFAEKFYLPAKKDLEWPLITGAALFGAGWGIAGFCPGPVLAALVTGMPGVLLFIAAMVAGQLLAAALERRLEGRKNPGPV